jgi:hypothetical protein
VDEPVTMAPTIPTTGWLGRWVDPALVLPRDLDRDRLEADEIERLLQDLAIVLFASQIPRRLGGEASAAELAEDKRRCRRTSWAIRQALLQWTKTIKLPSPVPDELRIAGASLEWQVFGEQHLGLLTERTKRAATWAALNDQRKWGGAIITRLENERRWITHSLR